MDYRDRAGFDAMMDSLIEYYNVKKDEREIYWKSLQKWSLNQIGDAFNELFQTEEFLPRVNKVAALLRKPMSERKYQDREPWTEKDQENLLNIHQRLLAENPALFMLINGGGSAGYREEHGFKIMRPLPLSEFQDADDVPF